MVDLSRCEVGSVFAAIVGVREVHHAHGHGVGEVQLRASCLGTNGVTMCLQKCSVLRGRLSTLVYLMWRLGPRPDYKQTAAVRFYRVLARQGGA